MRIEEWLGGRWWEVTRQREAQESWPHARVRRPSKREILVGGVGGGHVLSPKGWEQLVPMPPCQPPTLK